jgi:hypothetical protein
MAFDDPFFQKFVRVSKCFQWQGLESQEKYLSLDLELQNRPADHWLGRPKDSDFVACCCCCCSLLLFPTTFDFFVAEIHG